MELGELAAHHYLCKVCSSVHECVVCAARDWALPYTEMVVLNPTTLGCAVGGSAVLRSHLGASPGNLSAH